MFPPSSKPPLLSNFFTSLVYTSVPQNKNTRNGESVILNNFLVDDFLRVWFLPSLCGMSWTLGYCAHCSSLKWTQTIFYSFVLNGLLLVFNINRLHLNCWLNLLDFFFKEKWKVQSEIMFFELSTFQDDMLPALFISNILGGIETWIFVAMWILFLSL